VTSTLEPLRAPARGAATEAALRARLLGARASDRLWGWLGPLVIAALGGLLRLYHLQYPSQLVFDETYYVKEAASYLRVGYELGTKPGVKSPDNLFTHGNPDVFGTGADFVVHPPVGKWMIAMGEWVLGVNNPWGWRLASAVVGTLSILMIGRVARRLFGSTLLGCTAALLLSVDGQHFVHSRTGLLDVFVMFWALAGFACLLIDRDQVRARLAAKVAAGRRVTTFGPGAGMRWWRVAAGVCLGLCIGTKWSGLYFLAGFAVLSVLWDLSARRALGARHWWLGGAVRDGGWAAVQLLPVAAATYLVSWTGWLVTRGGYDRTWGAEHPSAHYGWVPNALRSLWKYHQEMYHFHVTLRADHPYKSNPWSWLVLGRPTAFFYKSYKEGQHGCTVADCSRAISALGNPVIWWGGTVAIAVLLFCWLLRRDWRAGAILAGLAAGYLPWFAFQERTIYSFYAVAFVPWVVLALTYVVGLLLGPSDARPQRRLKGATAAGLLVLAAVVAFGFFYPVYVADTIPHLHWSDRMWLPSWI
jgi:dolichyl-phosphate-mannose-protein mannosyltransferase